jgi:hypothetical protein
VPSSAAPTAADVLEPIAGLLGEWESRQGLTVAFRPDGVLLLAGEATHYRVGKLLISVLHEGQELHLPYELSDDQLVLGAGETRQEFCRKGAAATLADNTTAVSSGLLQDGGYSEEDAKSFAGTLNRLSPDERSQGRIAMLLTSGYTGVRSLFLLAQKLPGSVILQQECVAMVGLVLLWLSGGRLTDRADEDERRAMVAQEILKAGEVVRGLDRLAARAVMSLPEGHPLRDIHAAQEALLRQLDFSLGRRLWGAWISTAISLIEYEFVNETAVSVLDAIAEAILDKDPDEIFREQIDDAKQSLVGSGFAAIGLPDHDPEEMREELRKEFRRVVLIYHCGNAIRARDEGDEVAFQGSIEKAETQWHRFSEGCNDKASKDAEALNLMGLVKDLANEPKEAADYYAQALATGQLGTRAARDTARREAALRARACEWRRAIDLLEPILPTLEAEYLVEVEDGAVQSAGAAFCKAAEDLSFSLASSDCWGKALIALDRAKSLRLRHRAALRERGDAEAIAQVERELYATTRGATPDGPFQRVADLDLVGGKLSRPTRTLEIYRQAREGYTSDLLSSPTVGEVAGNLKADEACAILGVHSVGTMLAIIFPGDTEEPGARRILNDLTWTRLHQCMARDKDGWLYINLLPIMVSTAHREAIHELIPPLDQAVGTPLAELLENHQVRRLTIIPHHFLHLAPFWVLPSLSSYQTTVVPSAAHFIRSRSPRPVTARTVLSVIDPTLDLPLSPAEADAIDCHLTPAGWMPKRLSRRDALEEKIVEGIQGVAILHFSGHGQSNGLHPLKSCMLLHPNLDRFAALGADPLERLAAEVEKWELDPWQGIHTTFPGLGRLYQIVYKEADVTERFLEYSDTGTLWHRYRGTTLTHRAEQWRAGDIMVQAAFANCRLAFLSSCHSGAGLTRRPDARWRWLGRGEPVAGRRRHHGALCRRLLRRA